MENNKISAIVRRVYYENVEPCASLLVKCRATRDYLQGSMDIDIVIDNALITILIVN